MTASSSLRQIDQIEPSIAGILEAHASKHVGVAIGLLAGNMMRTFAHGALLEDESSSAEGVIFEIGSITKVFTATLLADMALAGEVALDDPVQMHLPDHVRLAQRGRPITLADLSSHVSGLSRLPPGFLRSLTKQQRSNPYADFGVDDLYRAVGAVRLRRPPGAKVRYSNFGAGLLGAVLARRAGTSYEQLVQGRICVPLGLRGTSIDVPAAKLGRFADGHDRRGRAAAHWDALALAGAGALRSTVADMLVFIRLQLGAPAVEVWVERGQPRAHLMGLQIGLGENRVRLALADPHLLGERAHGPVRLALGRLRAGGLEHLDALVVVIAAGHARTRQIGEPLHSPLSEAPAPLADLLLGEPDLAGDPTVGLALGSGQHHPRAGHHPLLTTRRAHDLPERRALLARQHDRHRHPGHHPLQARHQGRAWIRGACRRSLHMQRNSRTEY